MPMLTLPTLSWTQSPNFSSRGGDVIRLIVVHDCEGSYDGSIAWFSTPKSKVSAHYVLDKSGDDATQMVQCANKAWHCCAFNSASIGIEMEGFEANGFPAEEWQSMANVVAYMLHAYGLPAQWATGGQGAGFCRHYDLGVAGGSHHDPTMDPAAWQAFCQQVQQAAAQPMPASWPVAGSREAPTLPEGFSTTHDNLDDLRPGSLEWVQMSLNALGVSKTPLQVDGLDTQQTRDAIEAFKTKSGIEATEFLNSQTIRALMKAIQSL